MTVSSDDTPISRGLVPTKERPARELAVEVVFRPLAWLLVLVLVPLRVPPPAVVLVHGGIGLAAAATLAAGELVLAAVLLQLKTLLDNADGALARATGRVTALGRYLDTVLDLAVNAAVFAALGHVTGQPWLALAGLAAVTLVLSADFNLSELYRDAHGQPSELPRLTGSAAERALAAVYRVVFEPQDRLLRALARGRLQAIVRSGRDPGRVAAATLAYHDRATLALLANLGLSSLLLALGVCLVLGSPSSFLWLAGASSLALPVLQLRRELRARRALAR